MNKIDFIYLKLCQKYGNKNIFLRRNINTHYEMKPNEDNVWEFSEELGLSLGPIEFYKYGYGSEGNYNNLIKIDLKQEAESGTFED